MTELLKTPSQVRQELRQRLAGKFKNETPRSTCLLLDTSGSMAGDMDELRKLAADFTGYRRFQFSTFCSELDPISHVPDAGGGTDMGYAFSHVKSAGIKHIVLLTDGAPNSEGDALFNSIGLRIDIIYIGPPPPPPFLERLAKHTGGKYSSGSLDILKELTEQIRRLLPAPGIQL